MYKEIGWSCQDGDKKKKKIGIGGRNATSSLKAIYIKYNIHCRRK